MNYYDFYLVNVFAESHFGGNPLAVFPDAEGLSDQQMQLIARQFNLSETVFILPPKQPQTVKKYRIFTPDYEMPFAGHPTIGASFILHSHYSAEKRYTIETQAGLVDISHRGTGVEFALKNGVKTQPSHLSVAETAEFLGLTPQEVKNEPVWVNTGTWQLLAELTHSQAVHNAVPNSASFLAKTKSDFAPSQCYLWHRENEQVTSRMFFVQSGAILEDPGTGSAAANLAGLQILRKKTPLEWVIHQGDKMQRPNRLTIRVDHENTIFVGGNVIEVGKGCFALPN
ncbi:MULTISPECIES: PhzF family phenazine biosynthesis protein [Rodentibacter]|uniref:PhzF family phenazine biosynthesis protein n=1 Tax=Rodentibacter TaxID=1960084 RepID=UPI001CFE442F|nr:PhzF family phenazine biosynthesis protein [Rodentibacter sp. JRC1]GJI55689.1 hypothetical protein HEMROJRC1_08010 [Rodentibacter sp. JRC1]